MFKLTSPYNFVPLNERVYIPSWYNEVSQDIPFEDGEDGWIEVTWRNVSPLIIKEKADKEDDNCKKSVPVYVEDADGKKRYFIPGTSMKGMLRSTLEILSFGKMEQYDDRFFGHREFGTKKIEGSDYQKEMKDVRWGWLRMDDDDMILSPCSSKVESKPISDLRKKYLGFDEKISQWDRNEFIAKKSGKGMFPEIKTGYRLYCTGQMHNKKQEYLIPNPIAIGREEKLPDETKKAFLTVHAPTPDFEKFKALLDKGEMIPVSYIKKNDKIVAVGLSRMLRLPYGQSVRTLVEKEQKPVDGRDLCETIFGYTDKNASLRGRVQVSHAFCTDEPDGKELLLDEVGGVLGEPKPSFYPLYLKQTGIGYKTFNEAEGIAGRKLYRVHTGDSLSSLPQGNGNDNTTSYFRPLRTGLTFVMRINLHNMRPMEIGAILSALTMHNTKDAWHNIGGGKSFGYGKLECVKVELKGLKHQEKEEYMRAFEEEMECFTRTNLQIKWSKTNQIKMLVGILSEHNNDDVRMMELKEYGEASKNIYFQQLKKAVKETDRGIISLLTPDFEEKLQDEVFRRKNKDLYVKAETLEKDGKLEEAKGVYETLINERFRCDLNTDREETKKKDIEEKIAEQVRKAAEDKEKEKRKKLKGLKALLEEKYPDGRYKRDTIKKALDITDGWLKKAGRKELTEQEKNDLYSTLNRLKSEQNKADKKVWSNPLNRKWRRIENMIDKELTEKLSKEAIS